MKKLSTLVLALSFLLNLFKPNSVRAQSGTWINPNGGSWANSSNWQGGVIAQGTDSTADFSTLMLSADATVTLDGAQTIGSVVFGDQGGAHNWFLDTGTGGTLAFSGSTLPTAITVSNQAATIGAVLGGTQGLTQNGNGTLVLLESPGYFGGTTNDAGTFELLSSINTSNSPSFNAPLVINSVFESGAMLSLDVTSNIDEGSTNVLGSGTLRLVGTNNSSTSPDLFFCPDAVDNDFYGACIDVSNLDLGDTQRYIFALTEHNAISRYDPYEDARINSSISGTGGITYIAQNTYVASAPMECQLVLAGSNTFTGPVEIQRGSIYLLNANALVQSNILFMDPAASNNARFFLYGNGATVANLESGGAGTTVIANGNVNNDISVPDATLTVIQTSNTVFSGALVDGQYEYDVGATPPGSLSLVKDGSGILTLSGANSYTGSTIVNYGELVIPAIQTGGGTFTVADGAALGVWGINGNGVEMSDLALGVSSNTTVEFTFSGKPVAFLAPITTSTLEANGGANSVTINIATNGAGIPVGQYPLIQYTSGSIGGTGAGFSAFHIGTLPSGVAASLVNDNTNNSIDLLVTTGSAAPSQNGAWSNPNGGSWANSANWQGGNIASGIGFTADFSALTLSADATVTLDGPETIGNLVFGDQGAAHNWFLNTGSSGSLTLRVSAASPTITVTNQTATIGAALVGTQGLTQNGNGTLVLVQPVGYTGGTANISGTLELLGNFSAANNQTFPTPLEIDGVVETAARLNLDVSQNNDAGSTNLFGSGTLRLIGTTNSSTSPDLFFAPDAVGNSFYGAAMDQSNLDLGDIQRYIFALTEHNAVAEYDPYEDARINSSISGTAGITYIAQNSYGGSAPIECPLVLAGSNTFTGMLEIQRGSIYLFNASGLVQTNKLLIDPAINNNARLFLYGNGVTVANLESSGAGNALIANGNVANPVSIAPVTLTVIQTTNTTFGGIILDGQDEYDTGGFSAGPLSVLKSGPGTLTLTGPNGYSGSTTVAEGELVVSAATTNSSTYSVADGAALGVAGINTNGLLLTDLALGVSGNTTLEFNFSGAPGSAPAPITTASLEANGGSNSVTINIQASGVSIPVSQFPLVQYTSGSIGGGAAGFGAFHLGALPPGMEANLVDNTGNNSIDLDVTKVSMAGQAPLVSGVQIGSNGVFSMSLTGVEGTGFTVRASTNLALTPVSAWTVVGTGTLGAGVTPFDDPGSTNFPARYYQISTP